MKKSKKVEFLKRTIALTIALCMFFSSSLGFLSEGVLVAYAAEVGTESDGDGIEAEDFISEADAPDSHADDCLDDDCLGCLTKVDCEEGDSLCECTEAGCAEDDCLCECTETGCLDDCLCECAEAGCLNDDCLDDDCLGDCYETVSPLSASIGFSPYSTGSGYIIDNDNIVFNFEDLSAGPLVAPYRTISSNPVAEIFDDNGNKVLRYKPNSGNNGGIVIPVTIPAGMTLADFEKISFKVKADTAAGGKNVEFFGAARDFAFPAWHEEGANTSRRIGAWGGDGTEISNGWNTREFDILPAVNSLAGDIDVYIGINYLGNAAETGQYYYFDDIILHKRTSIAYTPSVNGSRSQVSSTEITMTFTAPVTLDISEIEFTPVTVNQGLSKDAVTKVDSEGKVWKLTFTGQVEAAGNAKLKINQAGIQDEEKTVLLHVEIPAPALNADTDCVWVKAFDLGAVGATVNTANNQVTLTGAYGNNFIYFDVPLNGSTIYDYESLAFQLKGISGDIGFKNIGLTADEPKSPAGTFASYNAIASTVQYVGPTSQANVNFNLIEADQLVIYDKNQAATEMRFALNFPAAITGSTGGADSPTIYEITDIRLVSKSCDNGDCAGCNPDPSAPPELSSGSVNRTSDTAATIGFNLSKAGAAFYLVQNRGTLAPNAEAVAAGTSLGAVTAGAVIGKAITLTAGDKDIYVVVEDDIGGLSNVLTIAADAFALGNPVVPLPVTGFVKSDGMQQLQVDAPSDSMTLVYGNSGHGNVYVRTSLPTAPVGYPQLESITLTYQGPDRGNDDSVSMDSFRDQIRLLALNSSPTGWIGTDASISDRTIAASGIIENAEVNAKTVTFAIDQQKLAALGTVSQLVLYVHANPQSTYTYSDIFLSYAEECCDGTCSPCDCETVPGGKWCKWTAPGQCCYEELAVIETNASDCIAVEFDDIQLVGATKSEGEITLTAGHGGNMIFFDVAIPAGNTIYDYSGLSYTFRGKSGDNAYKSMPLSAGKVLESPGLLANYATIASNQGNGMASSIGMSNLQFSFTDSALRDLYNNNDTKNGPIRFATNLYAKATDNIVGENNGNTTVGGSTVFEIANIKLRSKSCSDENLCDVCYEPPAPPLPGENYMVSRYHPDRNSIVRVAVPRDGYDYELWSQAEVYIPETQTFESIDNGVVTMNIPPAEMREGKGGIFNTAWDKTFNVLVRSGKKFAHGNGMSNVNPAIPGLTTKEITDIVIDFEAEWETSDGAAYIAVYGWAFFKPESIPTTLADKVTPMEFSNEIEYYIIQQRSGGYNPALANGSQYYGEKEIDGIVYAFYVTDRIGQPMLNSNAGNFKQYWSVAKNDADQRTSGIISVSEHFEAWDEVGMIMDGALYEVSMKIESFTASFNSYGTASVTKNLLSYNAPPIPLPDNNNSSPSPSTPPQATPAPSPTPNYGNTPGASDLWNTVNNNLAADLTVIASGNVAESLASGNTAGNVAVNASGNGFDMVVNTGNDVIVPAKIFDTLQGTTGSVMLRTSAGVTFSISGGNIPAEFDHEKVDLSVRAGGKVDAPAAKVNEVIAGTITNVQIPMVSREDFGMVVGQHYALGAENAGNFANLYRFNEISGAFEYLGSFEINEKGQAMFGITGGADYVLTVSVNKPNLPIVATRVGSNYYTVVRGDNLSQIAQRHGMRLPQLLALNPEIRSPGQIRIGQLIRIR